MYEVKTLDLTNIVKDDNPTELVPAGKRIAELFVMNMPNGGAYRLKIGNGNPFIPISGPFSMEPVGDDESNHGLYFANDTAQAGVTVVLIIVYGTRDRLATVL